MGRYVRVERRGAIAIITMDRPPVNALNTELQSELAATFAELASAEGDLRVAVLSGAGQKAFVAGADIGEFPNMGGRNTPGHIADIARLVNSPEAFPLPVIAALHGFCLGGGCELALACDIRVGTETLRIGLPEITLGLIPGGGGTQRLPRTVSTGTARRIVYTGAFLTGAEALQYGLIDVLAPGADPLPTALELAEQIALKPATALMAAKATLKAAQSLPLSEGMLVEAAAFAGCVVSEDGREGVRAFLEKREPAWKHPRE